MAWQRGFFNDGTLGTAADRDHCTKDWESNTDGHLMFASDKYLGIERKNFVGFKEYMRAVFNRPFMKDSDKQVWFEKLSKKVEANSERERVLMELFGELRGGFRL